MPRSESIAQNVTRKEQRTRKRERISTWWWWWWVYIQWAHEEEECTYHARRDQQQLCCISDKTKGDQLIFFCNQQQASGRWEEEEETKDQMRPSADSTGSAAAAAAGVPMAGGGREKKKGNGWLRAKLLLLLPLRDMCRDLIRVPARTHCRNSRPGYRTSHPRLAAAASQPAAAIIIVRRSSCPDVFSAVAPAKCLFQIWRKRSTKRVGKGITSSHTHRLRLPRSLSQTHLSLSLSLSQTHLLSLSDPSCRSQVIVPAVYRECIQFVNTRVAASSEGTFQASFSPCIKEGHLLQAADLVSATSNGAENTTVLVDQAEHIFLCLQPPMGLKSLLCLQIRQRIFLCPQLWMGLTSSVPSLQKFYFCLSTTTLVCPHSYMHACNTEKERDAHCCSLFYFWQNQALLWGGIDNNCLNCEWGDHNLFCTLGHTNPPPPPPAKDIRNQQGSSQ